METFYESLSVQSKDLLRTVPVSPSFEWGQGRLFNLLQPLSTPPFSLRLIR